MTAPDPRIEAVAKVLRDAERVADPFGYSDIDMLAESIVAALPEPEQPETIGWAVLTSRQITDRARAEQLMASIASTPIGPRSYRVVRVVAE